MKRISILFTAIFAITLFISSVNVGAQEDFAIGATLENFTLTDTDGKSHSFKDLMGEKGAVIVFVSAQCPVVGQYNERISKFAADYKAKGINVVGINSNHTESLEWVKSNAAENYKFPVLIDKGNVLADKLGATVTPEVYYFNEKNVLVYHGAIDNNRSGENITEHFLRSALDSALSGKAVAKTRANAFGCTIKRLEKTKRD